MNAFARIDRHPTRAALWRFGLTLLVGFGAAALLARFALHRDATARGLLVAGVGAFALSLVPRVNRWFYIAWMGLGAAMGTVTSPIVLGVIYLVIITPVALWFRVTGRDALRRRLDRDATSYWEDYPRPDRHERYFDPY